MALNANPTSKQADIGFAAVLIAVAAWAVSEAGSYPGASGVYPQVLAILLAIGAALVILRRLKAAEIEGEPRLFLHTGRFLLGLAMLVAYVVAIGLLGYLLPSLAVGLIVPWLLGYRNLKLTAAVTTGTLLFIVVVFHLILGRPMPPDVLDMLLGALR
ncbi:MAG: tripartite tricarboxylate transporter TctB family protein [Rhizobiaceae bacterium]